MGELPKDPGLAFSSQTNSFANILGVIVENQDSPNNIAGVLVKELDPSGLAAAAGITSGDVIYSIGRIPIENVEDFNNALQKLESNKNTTIGVARNGIKRILSLTLTK